MKGKPGAITYIHIVPRKAIDSLLQNLLGSGDKNVPDSYTIRMDRCPQKIISQKFFLQILLSEETKQGKYKIELLR